MYIPIHLLKKLEWNIACNPQLCNAHCDLKSKQITEVVQRHNNNYLSNHFLRNWVSWKEVELLIRQVGESIVGHGAH